MGFSASPPASSAKLWKHYHNGGAGRDNPFISGREEGAESKRTVMGACQRLGVGVGAI